MTVKAHIQTENIDYTCKTGWILQEDGVNLWLLKLMFKQKIPTIQVKQGEYCKKMGSICDC